jgi:hypothetical protein
VGLADCVICGRTIDGDSAAVGLSDDAYPTWIPFVEDLRTSGLRLVHALCFAQQSGVQALVDVIHRHDRKVRKETLELINEVDRLRKPD